MTLIRGVRGDPGPGGGRGVARAVVHDQVNVPGRVGALVELLQEAGEGDRVVVLDRLGDHLPGGGLQRGDDGQRAVADVLDELRAHDTGHDDAMRRVTSRFTGILHGCLKHGRDYDEATAWSHRPELAQAA